MKIRQNDRSKSLASFLILIVLLLSSAAQADISQGIAAYYPFNGNGLDESGNANHTLINGAMLTQDRFGQSDSAYAFDGINDTLFALSSDSLNPKTAVTISVWIYLESYPTTWMSIVNKWHSYVLQLHPDYGLSLMIFDQTSKAIMRGVSAQSDFELNTWYHISASYDESTGAAAWYINGVSMPYSPRPPYGYPNLLNDSNDNLKIGSENANQWWHGKIDDIRIYDRALSEAEVLELYNDQSTYKAPAAEATLLNLNVSGFEVDLSSGNIRLHANIDPNDPVIQKLLANPKVRISIELETDDGNGGSNMGILGQSTLQTETQVNPAGLLYGVLPDLSTSDNSPEVCETIHDYGHHYGIHKEKHRHKKHHDKNKHRDGNSISFE